MPTLSPSTRAAARARFACVPLRRVIVCILAPARQGTCSNTSRPPRQAWASSHQPALRCKEWLPFCRVRAVEPAHLGRLAQGRLPDRRWPARTAHGRLCDAHAPREQLRLGGLVDAATRLGLGVSLVARAALPRLNAQRRPPPARARTASGGKGSLSRDGSSRGTGMMR